MDKTKQTGLKLTRKQQAFVNYMLEHPKESATKAVKATYNTTTNHSAEVVASENLRKPEIIMALGQANELVENTLINTVKDWGTEDNSRKREIAIDSAKYIHDKIHGKATQRLDLKSTVVTLNIDLTSDSTTP